jgi:hypothetical protein
LPDEPEFDFEASLTSEFQDRGLIPTDETTPEEPTAEPELEDVTPEPEAEAEPEAEGRPRDEQGGFLPKDEPAPEPILGKFKTQDDLVQAYQQLEQRMGQTSAEREELNRLRQQVEAIQQQQIQPTYDGEALETLDTWFEENPHQIPQVAQTALQKQDGVLYDRAVRAWYELDPRGAGAFERRVELAQMEHRLRSEQAQVNAPIQEDAQEREFASVIRELVVEHPDFDKYSQQIPSAAELAPEVVEVLQKGTREAKKRVVESLYWMARGRAADNLAGAAQEAAQQQSDEAKARKTGAVVASSQTSSPLAGGTAQQRFAQRIVDAEIDL